MRACVWRVSLRIRAVVRLCCAVVCAVCDLYTCVADGGVVVGCWLMLVVGVVAVVAAVRVRCM